MKYLRLFTVLTVASFLTACSAEQEEATVSAEQEEPMVSTAQEEAATPSLVPVSMGQVQGEYALADAENGDLMVRDDEIYFNEDGKYGVGYWDAQPGSMINGGAAYDELMFVLSGSVILTDEAGAAETYSVGEGVVVKKGWKGTLTVPEGGFEMLWSIYYPETTSDTAGTLIRLDAERVGGENLSEYAPYEPEIGNLIARGHEYFYSDDGEFGVGIWESKPGALTYEGLGFDELMFVLEGSFTMTDAEGNSQTFNVGEGVMLPKGYSGTLSVPEGGVRKIWTSYMGGLKGE